LLVPQEALLARKLTDPVQLKLRFEEGLRRELAKAAKEHRHSLNAEIVGRLKESLVSANLMDLYRQQAEIAATKTADQVIKRLRSETQRDRTNERSLLGNVGQRTIAEALSDPAPSDSATNLNEKDTGS
jgi:Arc-like DNA binding domain